MRPPVTGPALTLLGLTLSASLAAQTRHARHLGVDHGLVPAYVVSLAQDHDGLLWIGTSGGVYRYDGAEMRRWAPEMLRSWVSTIQVTPSGALVVLEEDQGSIFTITSGGARPVLGPAGDPLDGVHHLAVDATGTIWTLRGDEVISRDATGQWTILHQSMLDGTRTHRVFAAPDHGAFVLTSAGIWLVTPSDAPRRLAEVEQPRHVLALDDGRLLVVTFGGQVLHVEHGRIAVLLRLDARGISAAERNGTYWVAFDRYLASFVRGAPPEIIGTEDGLASGGPLLVDHEGSLWMGTIAGLMQFPEPDTRIWTERDGLPSTHTRFLAKTGDTIWVSTWSGVGTIAPVAGQWSVATVGGWTSVRRLIASGDGSLRGTAPELHGLLAFDAKHDGSEWYGTLRGLLVAPSAGSALRSVTALPFSSDTVPINAVLHDRTGRTWLASERVVCRTRNLTVATAAQAAWICDEIDSGHHVSDLWESPSGTVWAAFVRGGMWQHRNGAWEPLGDPPLFDVIGLVESPSGGAWALGSRMAVRLIEDSGSPGGVKVAENLSVWHGLRMTAAEHLIEEPDGTLWITTGGGVARIPAAARRPTGPPRPVVLVDASVDEDRVPLAEGLVLPFNRNRLTLRFAAPSYRDPSRLEYQVRISPDEPWTAVSGAPVFRWVDLRPGRYQAEVRASLDGQAWTTESARFAFRVLPPWYRTPWALTLFGLAAASTAVAVYRARLAYLVGLERQRTRIAMDLHDEMGSGLGSIGILSGVLASEPSDPSDRRKLVEQIGEISQDLGTALSDIVWSLDARTGTLQDVATRLAEHGARLFSGDSVQFSTRFPEAWPVTPLAFTVRRGILLIGLEALHNAARHARARDVTLAFRQVGDAWHLVVEDDGCGLSHARRHGDGAGVGLHSLRRRAAEIDGRIEWSDRPEGGTRVTLEFRCRSARARTTGP